MSKLQEIIRDYHCYDQHGDCCESCQECENSLREDLIELIAKVRADAIDEFADWLVKQEILGSRVISDGEITDYGKVYAKRFKEQLKE